MNTRIVRSAAILALLASVSVPRLAGANLVANGSLEMTPSPPGTVLLSPGSAALSPWEISRGNVECVSSGVWAAADGSCSIALNGSTAGGVSQAFATIPGGLYGISFMLSADPHSGIHSVRVAAAGASQDFVFDSAPGWEWAMGWTTKTWEFTAVSSSTTVEFYSLVPASDVGPAIDKVDVTLVSLVGAGDLAHGLALAPAAPNPASGATRIGWSLPRAGEARVAVFDVRGREVAHIASGPQSAGPHAAHWDASSVPPGVYLVVLASEGETRTSRIAVVR
jgi:choice-of-anchor C domain-containing protein